MKLSPLSVAIDAKGVRNCEKAYIASMELFIRWRQYAFKLQTKQAFLYPAIKLANIPWVEDVR